MKVGLKMLRGSTLLGGAEIVNNGCAFLRNVILARLLSREDFGIAATLALVVSLFELSGKMSFGQQVIQSKTADDPEFLASTHASQALTGILSTILILLCSYPLAHWFGMETHRGTLMLMAIIPLCAGFTSLENYRFVRHLRFAPLILTDTVPQIMITLAAWPLAAWFRDYRAIIILLLVKSVFSLITSHLVAERSYKLSLVPERVKANLRFGWPLVVSGYLMFGVSQGDRMLIVGTYTLADLGVYAVAATIAMTPCFVIFRISGTVALPVLAAAQGDPPKFREYYRLYAQALALCSAVFVVGMILGGEPVITMLFGKKYSDAAALASWVMIGQAFRILRGAPTSAAMAKGDTVNTMSANLWRLSGLALAIPVVFLKWDLRWVAIAGGVGEMLALAASLVRLRMKHHLPSGYLLYPACFVAAFAIAAYAAKGSLATGNTAGALALTVAGCTAVLVVFGIFFGRLRQVTLTLLMDVRLKIKEILNNRAKSAASRA